MSAVTPLSYLIGIDPHNLTREEGIILEAELLSQICVELKENFKKQYQDYFRLLRYTKDMEIEMLETNFTKLVIKDILLTKEYTVEGLANYLGVHEDVIHEVMCGRNTNPSAILLQRAIDLHRIVRGDLYHTIVQKVVLEHCKNIT